MFNVLPSSSSQTPSIEIDNSALLAIAFNETIEESERIAASLELINQNYDDPEFQFITQITPLILKSNNFEAWVSILSHPLFDATNLQIFNARFNDENLNKVFEVLAKCDVSIITNTMSMLSHLEDSGIILNFCLLGLVDYFSFETISKVIDALPLMMIESIIIPPAETEVDPYFNLFFINHIVKRYPDNWETMSDKAKQSIRDIRVEYPELADKTQELIQHFVDPAARYHDDYLMEPAPPTEPSSRESSLERNSVSSRILSERSKEIADYGEFQNTKMSDLLTENTQDNSKASQVSSVTEAHTPRQEIDGELPVELRRVSLKRPPPAGMLGRFYALFKPTAKKPQKPPKPKT